MKVPISQDGVSPVSVAFKAGSPDGFQREGICLVQDTERIPVKRMTGSVTSSVRVSLPLKGTQLALRSPHESRTVCGQREGVHVTDGLCPSP